MHNPESQFTAGKSCFTDGHLPRRSQDLGHLEARNNNATYKHTFRYLVQKYCIYILVWMNTAPDQGMVSLPMVEAN